MKNKLLTSLLVTALCAGAARADEAAPATTASAPAPAPANDTAVATATPALPAPTQIVYAPKLPTVSELQSAAAAQGLGIDRVVQTATQVIAFYRTSNGQTSTVAYQTLPPAGHSQTPTPVTVPAPAQPVTITTAPNVVYQTAPRVIYYDDYPATYYYPRYWYPPVSLSFGFGYSSFHGGFGGYHRRWR